MRAKKKVSIKDIARLSGVSVATVSRVINQNGRFSEETRRRVEKVIKEYHYTTNMTGKSLRESKSNTIGVIVPDISNELFAEIVLELEKYFFPQADTIIDAIHEKIMPIAGYIPTHNFTTIEKMRRSKEGV